jgi:hypothetical protein
MATAAHGADAPPAPGPPEGALPAGRDARDRSGRRRAERVLVGMLTLAALGLAVTGLPYGLPEIYHPDTPKQLGRVPHFMAGRLVPEDTYPTLHIYAVALLLKYPLALVREPSFAVLPPTTTESAVVARLLSALLAAGLVPLVYLLGRQVFGASGAALTGAALTAVSPVLVLHAHYEMGDVPQAFLATLAVAAAAWATRTGRPAGLLLAGVAAGLAASAKYYGVLAFAAVPVALGVQAMPTRRRLRLAVAAGVLAVVAFALTTPKVLDDPLAFLGELRRSPDLFVIRPPAWWRRPAVGGALLAGLALAWFGALGSVLAVAGAAALAGRGPAGRVVLATPLAVLGAYVAWRANYLDDRNLVILVPFVALATAAALAWLGRRGRWGRLAAVALGAAVVGPAALESLHVAWLFWRGDTIRAAARWYARHVPPSVTVTERLYVDDLARYRAAGTDLLRTDSRVYERHLRWYAPRAYPHVGRSLELLETQGKLLKRFELLPRGFIAPTIAYYDLDSMAVPYAFPPPEDAAPGLDPLVFVDREALPERLAAVVEPDRPALLTIVSRTPLDRLAVALGGAGRVTLRHGAQRTRVHLRPGDLQLVRLEPRRRPPWLTHAYPLRITAREGAAYARLLVTPCDGADVLARYGRWTEARQALEGCQGGRWGEPARLLALAEGYAREGRATDARRAVEALERAAPGLAGGLAGLAAEEDEAAWRERYRTLAGHPRWFWQAHTFALEAEEVPDRRLGAVVDAEGARGGRAVVARAGRTPAGVLRAAFPQDFARGRYRVRFRLRGAAEGGRPVATLEVVRRVRDTRPEVLARRDWTPGDATGEFREIVVPVASDREPARLEARVRYHGRGTLEVDELAVLPDVRAEVAERMARLQEALAR